MQFSLIASLTAAVLFAVSFANAHECEPPARVEVDVAPTPFEPGLSKLVAAHLSREAAGAKDGEVCAASIRIEVTWPDRDHADVRVEVRRVNVVHTAVRTVDLTKVPSDGRSLAISIAATELVDETVDAGRTVPPSKVATSDAPARSTPPIRTERDVLGSFGIHVALDAFTNGPALLGTDAYTSFLITPRIDASFWFGVRAPLDVAHAGSSYDFGAALGISTPPVSHPWGVRGDLRVHAIALRAPDWHATILVPAIGGGAWLRAGSIARLTLDTSMGAPFRTEGTTARGILISAAVGAAVSF